MVMEEYDKIHAMSHGMMMTETNYPKVSSYVRQFEGIRLKPYKCPSGKLTIGYGHNLEDNGISVEIAEELLKKDLDNANWECYKRLGCYSCLDDARRFVLLDMCFNMGINKLLSFKKMLAALDKKDFATAKKELLNSKYATQTKTRAQTLAHILETGVW